MSGAAAASTTLFLDETPGETRGAVMRDGRFTHLLIQRDDDEPRTRLGARSVGRIVEIRPGLGAFVDLGVDRPGFLSVRRGESVRQGDRLEAVVVAEPRDGKGATLRRLGPGEGDPRLVTPGPSVAEALRALAPDARIETGLDALDAGVEAADEALAERFAFPAFGLDLAIQRTRALVAIDFDHLPDAGRDPAQARRRANAEGLRQAARLIGLKNWAGLVVVDLIGGGGEGEAQLKAARAAFAREPQAAFGPVSRFGLLQLSLPWTRTPVETVLAASARTRAQDLVRALRRHMLTDTASPRVTVRCAPQEAGIVAPLAARLGPRAVVAADPAIAPGGGKIEAS